MKKQYLYRIILNSYRTTSIHVILNRRISARNATRSETGLLIDAKKRQAQASATPRKTKVFGKRINLPNPQG